MSLSTELVTTLNSSGISNILVFSDSFPAVKAITPHTVSINAIATPRDIGNRERTIYSMRFLVSGSASGSMTKAWEIFKYLLAENTNDGPIWLADMSRQTASYIINKVLAESEPAFSFNRGNVFYSTFQLRFFASLK